MTHSIDCHISETHELTVGCEDCEAKVVGDCDNQTLRNVCGFSRSNLEAEFGSDGPYRAFWDVIVGANAMRVRARFREGSR